MALFLSKKYISRNLISANHNLKKILIINDDIECCVWVYGWVPPPHGGGGEHLPTFTL